MKAAFRTNNGVVLPSKPLLSRVLEKRIGPSANLRCRSTSSTSSHSSFFNRERELQILDGVCELPPSQIHVLLGPRNCGKTALLSHYHRQKAGVVHVDCRGFYASDPTIFAQVLLAKVFTSLMSIAPEVLQQQLLRTLADVVLPSVSQATIPVGDSFDILGSNGWTAQPGNPTKALLAHFARAQPSESQALHAMFQVLRKSLAAYEEARARNELTSMGVRPVIIVDEANVLMAWQDVHPKALAALLRFFIAITKQERHCHVFLATSEYGFQEWMYRAIGSGFWATAVIGDFKEGEARAFFTKTMADLVLQTEDKQDIAMDDEVWREVYQVCGGNAGTLVRLATIVCNPAWKGDFESALEDLWSTEVDRVEQLPLGGEGWTHSQYATVALAVIDSKHHAVPEDDILMRLGASKLVEKERTADLIATGRPVLERLVEAKAFSVRPVSRWADGLGAEAFQGDVRVVTAPSAVELFIMKRRAAEAELSTERLKRRLQMNQ